MLLLKCVALAAFAARATCFDEAPVPALWRSAAGHVFSGDAIKLSTVLQRAGASDINFVHKTGETLLTLSLRGWQSYAEASLGRDGYDARAYAATVATLLRAGATPSLQCPVLDAVVSRNAHALALLLGRNANTAAAATRDCWVPNSAARGTVLHSAAGSTAPGLARIFMRTRYAHNKSAALRAVATAFGVSPGSDAAAAAGRLAGLRAPLLRADLDDAAPSAPTLARLLAALEEDSSPSFARDVLRARDARNMTAAQVACAAGGAGAVRELFRSALRVARASGARNAVKAAARTLQSKQAGMDAVGCIALAAVRGYANVIDAVAEELDAAAAAVGAAVEAAVFTSIFSSVNENGRTPCDTADIALVGETRRRVRAAIIRAGGLCSLADGVRGGGGGVGDKTAIISDRGGDSSAPAMGGCPPRPAHFGPPPVGSFNMADATRGGWSALDTKALTSFGLTSDALTNVLSEAWSSSPLPWACAAPAIAFDSDDANDVDGALARAFTRNEPIPFVLRRALPRGWLQPPLKGIENAEMAGDLPSRAYVSAWLGTVNTTWTDRPYGERYGSSKAESVTRGTIQEFLKGHLPPAPRAASSPPPPVVFDADVVGHPAHSRRFSPPAWPAALGVANSTPLMQLALGPSGSGSPPHFHGRAVNGLVVGAKLWVFVPPADAEFADADAAAWGAALHRNAETGRVLALLQGPRDIVSVPTHWGHGVINLADSLAFAFEEDD